MIRIQSVAVYKQIHWNWGIEVIFSDWEIRIAIAI